MGITRQTMKRVKNKKREAMGITRQTMKRIKDDVSEKKLIRDEFIGHQILNALGILETPVRPTIVEAQRVKMDQ